MYSQQPFRTSTGNSQNGFGFAGGNASRYQPTGFVQSAYGQNQAGFTNSAQQNAGAYYSQAQQFHAPNYRGDQPGHDEDLRGDAFSPMQSAYDGRDGFVGGVNPEVLRGNPSTGIQPMGQSSFGRGTMGGMGMGNIGSSSMGGMGMGNMGSSSIGSMGMGNMGSSSMRGMGMSSMGSSSMGGMGMNSSAMGSAGQFGAFGQTAPYHMANYRGNQPGHDQDLRGDAFSPNQSAYDGRDGFVGGVNPEVLRGNPSTGVQPMGQSSFGGGMGGMGMSNMSSSSMGNMGMRGMGSSSTMGGMGMSGMGSSSTMGGMGMSGMGSSSTMGGQFGQTMPYQMANYRGNQPGHDQDLRGDSFSPNQSAYDNRTGFVAAVNPEVVRGNPSTGVQPFGQSW